MVLIYSLIIISLIFIGIYYFIWKDRIKDRNNLDLDWQMFLKSEDSNDIKRLDYYGNKLIWNKYLQSEQLEKIINVVETRISDYPELKKLENNAYNKKLHYDRIFPSPGSSGGKKQSW